MDPCLVLFGLGSASLSARPRWRKRRRLISGNGGTARRLFSPRFRPVILRRPIFHSTVAAKSCSKADLVDEFTTGPGKTDKVDVYPPTVVSGLTGRKFASFTSSPENRRGPFYCLFINGAEFCAQIRTYQMCYSGVYYSYFHV